MSQIPGILWEASLRSLLVAGLVWAILKAGRVRTGSLLHLGWSVALAAMLLMPWLPRVAPPLAAPPPLAAAYDGAFQQPAGPPPQAAMAQAAPQALAAAPRTAAQPAATAQRASANPSLDWRTPLAAVWALVAFALALRMGAGWLRLRGLLRRAHRLAEFPDAVLESEAIATPATAGLLERRILLPVGWREWPQGKLRAALAHERAHVRRADTVVSFLAHLNRCVFWFHPLAWWMEKQIAAAAEQACDEAALAESTGRREYAEVLLDMAAATQRRGRRLSWQGVGVDGAGLLGERVDHILRSGPVARATRRQKIFLLAACAAGVFVAAACRSTTFAGLKPDPSDDSPRSHREYVKREKQLNAMTPEAAAAMEKRVADNPDDLDTRLELMRYYQRKAKDKDAAKQLSKAYYQHWLWTVEHHPEKAWGPSYWPAWDGEAEARGQQLWRAAAERPGADCRTLLAAADAFSRVDLRYAEQLNLRAQAAQCKGDAPYRLALIYSNAISDKRYADYAPEVRRTLAQTRDAALLAAVARNMFTWNFADEGNALLKRALELDPKQRTALMLQSMLAESERQRRLLGRGRFGERPGKNSTPEEEYQTAMRLPPADRFEALELVATRAVTAAEVQEYRSPKGPAKEQLDFAGKAAAEALALGPQATASSFYAENIHVCNLILAYNAMRLNQDAKGAAHYLREAAKTPVRLDNQFPRYFLTRLPVTLLRYGGADGRKAVQDYLDAAITIAQPEDVTRSARQLREGYVPSFAAWQLDSK